MTYSPALGLSYCEIAGAVAEAAIHDLRVNLFSFSGFPQIFVSRQSDDVFNVVLSWEAYETQFQLSKAEAKAAIKKFKSGTGVETSIFDRTQKALSALEGQIVTGR